VEEVVRSCRLLRFGTFEVDFPAGELRKSGVKLKLTGQPFQVLTILLERPGEVVTREELQKRLWPDTFVDVDHNLNTAINKIREVLGDSAESPRFDGRFFYVALPPGHRTFVIPVPAGRSLPDLPPAGIDPSTNAAALRGARLIDHGLITPGPNPAEYIFLKTDLQRNLFRIPLH